MKYIIDKKCGVPAYLQLYKQLKSDIVKGIYSYGAKLPSKRMLSEELAVSVITVEHSLALLCDEGYVEARERSGYFAVFKTDDGFADYGDTEPIKYIHSPFRADTDEEFPFSVLAKTMRSVISEYGEGILERSPNGGCDRLRAAISKYLARSRGIEADAEQIIIGSGSEYLYTLSVELLGNKRRYAIEFPSYKKIEQVYSAAGIEFERLPLGADGIESAALRKCRAEILHISPYRSFPSGVTASASKKHEYLRWASSVGRYIIEDDFESEFSVAKKPEETLFAVTNRDNVIYMNTFSKTISPALRIGYMVLPKGLVVPFREKLGFYSCTVPTFMQLVSAQLIENGDFERHINRVRRKKRKNNNFA